MTADTNRTAGRAKSRRRLPFPYRLGLLILLVCSCSPPTGLAPVSGWQGEVIVREEIFADGAITAVALVVIDQLIADSLANHFITYGDPILPCESGAGCDSTHTIFIQLRPGGYLIVPVGLTIDPAFFIVHLDSLLSSPSLPLVLPGDTPLEILQNSRSTLIQHQEITIDTPWEITF